MSNSTTTMIAQLLDDYVSFLTGSPTLSDYQNATKDLSCVFNAILEYPTSDNLNTVWNFFIANQNGVVQENIALYAVGVLSPNDRAVYNLVYTMFRQATNGTPPSTEGTALAVLIRSPILVAYLEAAYLTVTPGQETAPGDTPNPSSSTNSFSSVDVSKGFQIVNNQLTFNDTAMEAYILGILATFMATAPTDSSSLGTDIPWNNGGNLAFTPAT